MRFARLIPVLVAVGLSACGGRSAPVAVGPGAVVAEGDETGKDETPYQALYRVQYSGPEASGSFKLVVRWQAEDRFELAATDPLGRALWRLDSAATGHIFVDHRRRLFCRAARLHLREPALGSLPLGAIPRVLSGRVPAAVERDLAAAGSNEAVDLEGRRWRIRSGEEGLEAWTMWIEEEPTLWWVRRGKGGVLSHRDGSQFRWRRVLREELAEPLSDLEEDPSDLEQVSCDAIDVQQMRQDQP